MKLKTFLLVTAVMLIQSFAFSQNNPLVKYLPEDLSMVMSFDVKKLGSKIPSETFRQSFFYREMEKDNAMPVRSLFNDPGSFGIDLSPGIMVALKYQGSNREGRNQPTFYIFVKLSSAETFTQQIQKLFDQSDNPDNNIQTYGTDRISVSGGAMAAGWNNDVLVITNGNTAEMSAEIERYMQSFPREPLMSDTVVVSSDSPVISDTAVRPEFDFAGMTEKFKRSQRDLCFELLTAKPQNSFSNNTQFVEAMSSDADIKMWSGGRMNPLPEELLPLKGIMDKLEALGGKNKIALINFENGKIVAKARNFPSDEIAAIYKQYPTTTQNSDLLRRLPQGELFGFANVSFNRAFSGEMIQKSGLMQMIPDSLKKKIPFDIGLLPGVFKNELMIAVMKSDRVSGMKKMNGFELIIALPIADKAKFEKLKAAILPVWDSLNHKDEEQLFKEPKTLFAKNNDQLLVLSLRPETAAAFLNNPGTGEVPVLVQAYNKYPMLANINLKEIINTIMAGKGSRRSRLGMEDSRLLKTFDNILVYGGEYENGSINSTIEFRFVDQTENSFKQLFDLLAATMEKTGTMDEEDGSSYQDSNNADTMVVSSAEIIVPTFKDPEVQQFAKEYDAFIKEYITASKAKDSTKIYALNKKGDTIARSSEKASKKLAEDPEEAKKFSDWLMQLSGQLVQSIQSVTLDSVSMEEQKTPVPPPPPPAKPKKKPVEEKKFTPPVIKKD